MSTPAITLTLEQKQKNWSVFAVEIHNTETKLQLSCSSLVAELATLPETPDDLPEAEAILKRVKQSINDQDTLRKSITNKFDAVKKRMMLPVESAVAAVAPYEARILNIKQDERDALAKVKAKNDEIAKTREFFANVISSLHAQHESKILTKVGACLEKCLNTDVSPDALPMNKMKAIFTEKDFVTAIPNYVARTYTTQDEVNEIWAELTEKSVKPATEYLAQYHAALDEKFAYYGVALKNKSDALKLSQENQAAELAAIQANKDNAAVAAKLESIAAPEIDVMTEPTGKKIKTVYKLDLPDNEQSAILILTAFTANWQKCKEKLRITIWSNLSVKQMSAALEAVRKDDEKFNVTGLVWKAEDKL